MGILARLVALAFAAATIAAPATGADATSIGAVQGESIARELLFGRWTDNGDCTDTIEFLRDGRFHIARTGGEGIWALVDGRLVFQGTLTVNAMIEAPDADTILVYRDDGSRGRSTRCSGSGRAVAPAGAVTRDFLLGAWTDDDSCDETIEFLADGTYVVADGGGTWRLDGDVLTLLGGEAVSARVQAADEDSLLLINEDRSLGRSTRCDRAAPADREIIAAARVEAAGSRV